MKKNIEISISAFMEFFPELELPVTFSEDTHLDFSRSNEPLPQIGIQQYLVPIEGEVDEFTEFIPCIRIPNTYDFHAVVYWKAGLLNYQYRLVVFNKTGELMDSRVIAGLFTDGNTITRSLATIEEDWLINIVSGQTAVDKEKEYNAAESKTYALELIPDGRIVNALKA